MSRYQQAPYSDEPSSAYGNGNSYSQPYGQNAYGNNGGAPSGNGAYGGYSDDPRTGNGEGGHAKGYGAGGLASADECELSSIAKDKPEHRLKSEFVL